MTNAVAVSWASSDSKMWTGSNQLYWSSKQKGLGAGGMWKKPFGFEFFNGSMCAEGMGCGMRWVI